MDATSWIRWREHFLANRQGRPEPDWAAPCPLPAREKRLLARSLAHFALGESGDGKHLLEQAAFDPLVAAPAGPEALALFIREEQEHARLLHRLVDRYGGQPARRHWTHGLFQLVRRASGLVFELEVLVIAEMVGIAYYRLLEQRTADPVLRQACGLILADETAHIQFHIEHLGARQQDELPALRGLWSLRFQLLFSGACLCAYADHRRALGALGVDRKTFVRAARRELRAFLCGVGALPAAPLPRGVLGSPP